MRRAICVVVGTLVAISIARASNVRVTYHRGPVMSALNIHLVTWLPSGAHFEARDAVYLAALERFIRSLGGSAYYGIMRGYASAPGFGPVVEGPVTTQAHLASVTRDASPYPASLRTAGYVTMSSIRRELKRVVARRHMPESLDDLYVVLPGRTMRVCAELNGRCAPPAGGVAPLLTCATHGYFVPEDQPVVYVYLPVVRAQTGCAPDSTLSITRSADPTATLELDALARQAFDAASDPVGTGWYAGTPSGEIGNLCRGVARIDLRGATFLLPRIWNRVRRRCAFR